MSPLVAWYKLDGNALDSSGNGNHGSASNVSWVDGKIAQAGEFSSSYVSLNTPISSVGDFSVSFWGLTTSTANQNFACSRSSVGDGFSIFLLSGYLRIDTNSAFQWTTSYNYPLNQWVHITVTKTSTAKRLFVNGVFHSSTSSVPSDPLLLSSIYTFGASHSNGTGWGNYLLGKVDDYRIYDHALSEKEIKELAKAKILHYTFDEFQEPTENLFNFPFYENRVYGTPYTASSWGGDAATITYYESGGWNNLPYKKMVKTAGGDGGSYLDDNGPFTIENNTTYIVSAYMKANRNVGLNGYSLCINNGAQNIYRVGGSNSLTTEWQRFKWTYNSGADHAGTQYRTRHIVYIDDGLPLEVYWCAPQLEKKDHVTPFTVSSRPGTVSDNSGYDNHADLALATTPQWTEDSRIGKGAYEFNGTASNYIVFPHTSIGLPSLTNCTISFWRKKTTAGGWLLLRGQTNSHYVMATSSGTGNFYHSNAGTSWQIFVDGVIRANPIDDTNWHHYVMRNVDLSTWTELTLNNYSSWYFRGILDDFRIYNTVLTDDDIKELYQTRAQIDNKGNFFANNIEEPANIASIVNEAIVNKTFTNGVSSYTQANCQVSLTDNGYRIYRPANLIYPDAGRTMWGGLKINLFNNEESKIEKGKRYRISFLVNGKTSNSPGGVYFSNYMGWSGGGLTNVGFSYNDTIPTNFNGVKRVVAETNVIDDIYKACTTSYSSFVAGQYYNCYRDLCFGFGYQSTGTLGTDIYITDFKIQEITDNNKNNISENGIAKMFEISEIGPANGLVAYYPLNGDANDYANANDGTVNGAIISAGINGKACYSFDGVDDQINLLSTNSVDPEQGTVSAWFYMNGAQVNHATLFACQDGPSWANMRVNLGADGTTAIRFAVGNGTSSITNACSSGTITQNEWHHALGTYDGANIRIYIDGMLKNTVASTITPGTFTPNHTGIGSALGSLNQATRYWKGQIQDVRIYNRALSAEEITILYDLEKPNPTQMKLDSNTVYISGEFDERL